MAEALIRSRVPLDQCPGYLARTGALSYLKTCALCNHLPHDHGVQITSSVHKTIEELEAKVSSGARAPSALPPRPSPSRLAQLHGSPAATSAHALPPKPEPGRPAGKPEPLKPAPPVPPTRPVRATGASPVAPPPPPPPRPALPSPASFRLVAALAADRPVRPYSLDEPLLPAALIASPPPPSDAAAVPAAPLDEDPPLLQLVETLTLDEDEKRRHRPVSHVPPPRPEPDPSLKLSVSIRPRRSSFPAMPSEVDSTLDEFGYPPEQLEFDRFPSGDDVAEPRSETPPAAAAAAAAAEVSKPLPPATAASAPLDSPSRAIISTLGYSPSAVLILGPPPSSQEIEPPSTKRLPAPLLASLRRGPASPRTRVAKAVQPPTALRGSMMVKRLSRAASEFLRSKRAVSEPAPRQVVKHTWGRTSVVGLFFRAKARLSRGGGPPARKLTLGWTRLKGGADKQQRQQPKKRPLEIERNGEMSKAVGLGFSRRSLRRRGVITSQEIARYRDEQGGFVIEDVDSEFMKVDDAKPQPLSWLHEAEAAQQQQPIRWSQLSQMDEFL